MIKIQKRMFLWDTRGIRDQGTEMWKSDTYYLSRALEYDYALFFFSPRNKCILYCYYYSFTSPRSFFPLFKMKPCPCRLVARAHGSKHSFSEICNLLDGAIPNFVAMVRACAALLFLAFRCSTAVINTYLCYLSSHKLKQKCRSTLVVLLYN